MQDGEVMGTLLLELVWTQYYTGIFAEHSDLVDIVVENTCDGNTTFVVDMESNTMDPKPTKEEASDYDKEYSISWAKHDIALSTECSRSVA